MEKKHGRKTWRRSFSKEKTCSYRETKFMHEVMDHPYRIYSRAKKCFIWVPLIQYVGKHSTPAVNYNGKEYLCIMVHIPTGHPVCVSRQCQSCSNRHVVCQAKYDLHGNEYNKNECAEAI